MLKAIIWYRTLLTAAGWAKLLPGLTAAVAAGLVVGSAPGSTLAASGADDQDRPVLRIMTQNMDEATGFGAVMSATTPQQLVQAVGNTFLEVEASKMPERAAAVAHEIAVHKPDVVGLQEASIWRTGPLGRAPATTVVFDQLQSLLDALDQQGLHYTPVGVHIGLDAEAPSSLGFDVRVTDRDALLVRTDPPTSRFIIGNVEVHTFATILEVPNPLLGRVVVPRGWIQVDAQFAGTSVRIMTTHLDTVVPVQLAQGNELIQRFATSGTPVIMVGDFNSAAAGGPDSSATYARLRAAGFEDAWQVQHPQLSGFTWPLHGEDVEGQYLDRAQAARS